MRHQWGVAVKLWATVLLVAGLGLAGSASATLISRGADLVYDDVLDITWTRNANLPGSSGLTWAQANTWAADLSFAGFDDWRLSTSNLTSPTVTATDCGSVSAAACAASGNELGYMYYHNLGVGVGFGFWDKSGTQTAVGGEVLTGIQHVYWSGTEYGPDILQPDIAYDFLFFIGLQSLDFTGLVDLAAGPFTAWAVRSGDVSAAVPEPASLLLLGAGMLGLGWSRRRGQR